VNQVLTGTQWVLVCAKQETSTQRKGQGVNTVQSCLRGSRGLGIKDSCSSCRHTVAQLEQLPCFSGSSKPIHLRNPSLLWPELKQKSFTHTKRPGGVGQDHVHHRFAWRNAQSFYCFSRWEKAGLHFQCILKSTLHEKTMNELLISLYTLLRACT